MFKVESGPKHPVTVARKQVINIKKVSYMTCVGLIRFVDFDLQTNLVAWFFSRQTQLPDFTSARRPGPRHRTTAAPQGWFAQPDWTFSGRLSNLELEKNVTDSNKNRQTKSKVEWVLMIQKLKKLTVAKLDVFQVEEVEWLGKKNKLNYSWRVVVFWLLTIRYHLCIVPCFGVMVAIGSYFIIFPQNYVPCFPTCVMRNIIFRDPSQFSQLVQPSRLKSDHHLKGSTNPRTAEIIILGPGKDHQVCEILQARVVEKLQAGLVRL